jgi:hypothetical protein
MQKNEDMKPGLVFAAAVAITLLLLVIIEQTRVRAKMLTIVCTTPHTPARTSHMRALCRSEKLFPFALTTELGLFVDKNSPECARINSTFEPQGKPLEYAAHYATYLAALRYFLDRSDLPLLLILEDDIVRIANTTTSVHSAVANAPPFGLLFLEYCYANCKSPSWSNSAYAKGFGAYCTSACVFTRQGARDLLAFASANRPMVIDNLVNLYSNRDSVVYVTPAIFKQDRVAFAGGVSGVTMNEHYATCLE